MNLRSTSAQVEPLLPRGVGSLIHPEHPAGHPASADGSAPAPAGPTTGGRAQGGEGGRSFANSPVWAFNLSCDSESSKEINSELSILGVQWIEVR